MRGGHLLTVPGTCLTKCQPSDPFRRLDNSSTCRYVSWCAAGVTARVRGGLAPAPVAPEARRPVGPVAVAARTSWLGDTRPVRRRTVRRAFIRAGGRPHSPVAGHRSPCTCGGAMSGSHRRHHWLSSWWSRRRPPARRATSNVQPSPRAGFVTSSAQWSTGVTCELPALRYAPLMTRAQLFRGNGGRWPR